MDEQVKIFIEKIKGANSIAIMGHKNPDGDSLCSALALARLIELNFNKRPVCVYDGNVPDFLDGVPLRGYMHYYERVNLADSYDLVIIVDYGTANQIGGPEIIAKSAKYVIEIDHHRNENPIGAQLCINDLSAVATGQIVYEIIAAGKLTYDLDIANLLMISLITDTGQFRFVQSGRPMRIAADLIDFGVNIRELISELGVKNRKTLQVEARAVANAEFLYKNHLALAIIPHSDYKFLDGKGDTAMRLLAQVRDVECVVLLKQQKQNQIGISIRSRIQPIGHIASALGGGGHPCAAGALVYDSIENVRMRIIELFRGEFK